MGDVDNDGRLDVVVTAVDGALELWRNVSPAKNHWLSVAVEGVKGNRDGMGAQLTLVTAAGTQHNVVNTAVGYGSASDARVHFGLGSGNDRPRAQGRLADAADDDAAQRRGRPGPEGPGAEVAPRQRAATGLAGAAVALGQTTSSARALPSRIRYRCPGRRPVTRCFSPVAGHRTSSQATRFALPSPISCCRVERRSCLRCPPGDGSRAGRRRAHAQPEARADGRRLERTPSSRRVTHGCRSRGSRRARPGSVARELAAHHHEDVLVAVAVDVAEGDARALLQVADAAAVVTSWKRSPARCGTSGWA